MRPLPKSVYRERSVLYLHQYVAHNLRRDETGRCQPRDAPSLRCKDRFLSETARGLRSLVVAHVLAGHLAIHLVENLLRRLG
jgi:hypothetical protein